MVLFRALGWMLLVVAVAALVNDCLGWWSDGSFRLISLGGLWTRLDFSSLRYVQSAAAGRFSGLVATWFLRPVLAVPALPFFALAGIILIWLGHRGGRTDVGSVGGTRPPRRRRYRGGIS